MRTYKLIILGTMAAWMTACENANPEYDATGVFETTEVIVSAQDNGEIMQLTIEEGSEVSPNELLGHIDTIQLSLKRQQLTATLSATESRKLDVNKQLASIRQQIANLKTEQLRYEKLVKANAASQKQLDDINYNLEVLHKQLSATSEQIGSSNSSLSGQSAGIAAQVAQIDKQIEDCLITSPIKGIILSKYAEHRVRGLQQVDAAQQGGLAGTGGTDDGGHIALLHGEVNIQFIILHFANDFFQFLCL